MGWAGSPPVVAGACSGGDPGIVRLFFSDDQFDVDIAKRICTDCEVTQVCLEYAMANHEKGAVWGGVYINGKGRISSGPSKQGRPKGSINKK